MKKIVTIVAAALVASAAFAQVSIGAWGRGIWTPIAFDGENAVVADGTSWAPTAAPRVGFTIAGSSDNVGFVADLNVDGDKVSTTDCQYVWVKPLSWLDIKIGKTQDNSLRGDGCFGMFNWLRAGAAEVGEDFTFTRLGNGTGGQLHGASVTLTPIEGLFIAAGLDISDGNKWNKRGQDAKEFLSKGVQVQAGYTIANIGKVRAQYIAKGNGYTIEKDMKDSKWVHYGTVEAAFDLTAVENLFVTVGGKFNTADTYIPGKYTEASHSWVYNKDISDWEDKVTPGKYGDPTMQSAPIEINAYANYKIDALTIHAIFGSKFNMLAKDAVSKDDRVVGLMFGAGVDYAFENGIGLTADVRYQSPAYAEGDVNALDCVSFLAGVSKGFSNGSIGIGVEGTTNNNGPFRNGYVDDAEKFHAKGSEGIMNIAVPVVVTYWF